MTRVVLVVGTLALLGVARLSDAHPRIVDPRRSTVTVHVFKSGLFRAFAVAVQRDAADRWSVRGELEIHGQTRSLTINVVRAQDRYKGSTSLKQSDFGITPISIAGGTVKAKDEIKIDFEIVTAER